MSASAVAAEARPEEHSFQVRAGSLTHSKELVLSRERIQLAGLALLAEDVRWIRFQSVAMFHTGIKTGTTSQLAIGNAERLLTFSMHDLMYSRARTDMFHRIVAVVL